MTAAKTKKRKAKAIFEQGAFAIIGKIGSLPSIVIHTIFFLVFFILGILGYDWNRLLLILTTVVSLEAIYLAIFIQMTVNQNTQSLAEVEENIDEIQEDIDDIAEDVDEIQEDVDELQKDVDEIAEDEKEAETEDKKQTMTLEQIQNQLQHLAATIEDLRKPIRKK